MLGHCNGSTAKVWIKNPGGVIHRSERRRSFTSVIHPLHLVEKRITDLLIGYKIHGMGETYRHGGPGRDRKLQEAARAIEQHWKTALGWALRPDTKTAEQ